MKQDTSVIKMNKDIRINAATLVIAAVLLYVVIRVCMGASKEQITIYQVSKAEISNNLVLQGIAVRDEIIINATKSGHICYYNSDGEKVKKGSMVCTIDETGEIYNAANDTDALELSLTKEDYDSMRALILSYKLAYSDVRFSNTYNFEVNANNKVFELANKVLIEQNSNKTSGISSVTTPSSGLVTYCVDGYENFRISEQLRKSDFDKTGYEKKNLKSGDEVSAGDPVVKVIPSETWSVVAPITDEEREIIERSNYIRFRLNNSHFKMSMPYEIHECKDGDFVEIKIDKYMSNYMNERFLSVEILRADDTGLKIPSSSLINKNVYKIPISYLSAGSNQTSTNRINIEKKDENGEKTIQQMKPTIYKLDDKYAYVDPDAFEDSDILLDINSNQTIAASLLEPFELTGVYFANKGIAEFRRVTILKTIDEFVLIDKDEELKAYDNIVLDSSKVTENQLIY